MRPSIRSARAEEVSEITEMARKGLSAIHPDLPFDSETAAGAIANAIDDPSMLVAVAEDEKGLCGLVIARGEYSWFGPGGVASDWVTYVEPRAKGWLWYRLLSTYVEWAESLGATVINTTNASGKDDKRSVHAIGRLGFNRVGSMVRKVVNQDQRGF